jgi:MFS family permease
MKKYLKGALTTAATTRQLNPWQASTGLSIIGLGAVLIIGLGVVTALGADDSPAYLRLGILVVGLACGWLLGIMASPDDAEEQTRFSRMGTTAGTFLTGYVLSKIKWEDLKGPEQWSSEVMLRVLLFTGGLLVAALVTYSLREYVLLSPDARADADMTITEEHEFDVAGGTIGVLDCCADMPESARLRLRVLASDGVLYVARTDTTAAAFEPHTFPTNTVSLKNQMATDFKATDVGTTGRRLSMHNTGKKPARVSVAVMMPKIQPVST